MDQDRPLFEIDPACRFRLEPGFLAQFAGRQPPWGFNGLGHLVYQRTYARDLHGGPAVGSEDFARTAARVVEGTYSVLCQQVRRFHQRWDAARAQRDAQEMFERMWDFRWLPPGRGLWAMGTELVERKGAGALNNCGMVSTAGIDQEFAEPFCALMDFLMCGVGMGFDTAGAGKFIPRRPALAGPPHVVADTREGWVEALRAVLDAYAGLRPMPSGFDVSAVRPAGAPIRTFGGRASGPGPLLELLAAADRLLAARACAPVTSADIVDLCGWIGRCVVAGNVRRSALLALGDPEDELFVGLKDPRRLQEIAAELASLPVDDGARRRDLEDEAARHPLATHRWASNNTVRVRRGQRYAPLVAATVANGEPGYAWMDTIRAYGRLADPPDHRDSKAVGMNPCSEQSLWDGELCNLVETFPTRHASLEDWKRTLRFAYLYAKVVTCIPTHRPATNAVIARNRRIGCSMAGVFELYERLGMAECIRWWDEGYRYVRELDEDYSGWMGVPASIKRTSTKPGGSVPLLAGVEGGMKAPTARWYFRTVRLASDSPLAPAMERAGYRVEAALREPRTLVAYVPCAAPAGVRTAREVTVWEQAALHAALQRWWADNQVSCTLTFQPHEARDLAPLLAAYEGQFKAVSFLPLEDHAYPQAPYQPCTEQEFRRAAARLTALDFGALTSPARDTEDRFCEGDRCSLPGAPAEAST